MCEKGITPFLGRDERRRVAPRSGAEKTSSRSLRTWNMGNMLRSLFGTEKEPDYLSVAEVVFRYSWIACQLDIETSLGRRRN